MKSRFLISILCAVYAAIISGCSATPPASENSQLKLDRKLGSHATTNEFDEASWSARSRAVLKNALSLSGIRYQYGGNSPETGFDCSGFVRYVYQQAANLSLPHSAKAISQIGQSIPKHELQPGDLVFFNTLKSAFSHVGIYMGNGRFIHAPSSGGKVRIENMQENYWKNRFNGAQRIEASSK